MARIKHPDEGKPIDKSLTRRKTGKTKTKDPGYLKWLHQLECCITGSTDSNDTFRKLDAHHPRIGLYAAGMKAPDKTAVPVRHDYHSDQFPTGLHNGERAFWNQWGIDPVMLAEELYRAYQAGARPVDGCMLIRCHRELGTHRLMAGILIYD